MLLKTVNATTLKIWIDNGEALLLDVREPDEFQAQRIPGSTHLPLA